MGRKIGGEGFDGKESGFQLLDLAYETRSTELLNLKIEPIFDPLRGDPRFDALLRRLALE